LLSLIEEVAGQIDRQIFLMEVCGTHTQAISKNGLRSLLPKNVKLLSGPGCPVCVTAQADIDAVVVLAKAGVPIATYGDLLRVPGFFGSLEQARSQGAQVFAVYSIEEALELRKEYPELVFLGLGFETTTPMTALALEQGLTVFSAHKLFLPAMDELLRAGQTKIDGFLSPGHVAAIVGSRAFEFLQISQVIAGFEAEDVLVAIYLLLCQIRDGKKIVENEYVRLVSKKGNLVAQKLLAKHFVVCDGNWRGFGKIANSGLEVKNPKLNAKIKYQAILAKVDFSKSQDPAGCRCGEIVRAALEPSQCPMFGKVCTPENPYGPCMVSEEGACNNYFRYI